MRALLLAVALLASAAGAQEVRLRGELGLDTGVAVTRAADATRATVPLRIAGRLELDAEASPEATLRLVALPSLTAGGGADAPTLRAGLQEAFARLRLPSADLSLGLERLVLAEMRLVEPLALEVPLEAGEDRGVLGARVTAWPGPWRLRAALLAPAGEDLVPDGAGAALSVRREASGWSAEGHALWAERPALGATFSASLEGIVVYGEAWLLAEPWSGRGGLGATGYAGDWAWTAEAGVAAPDGALAAPAAPVVALSAARPFGADAALDVTLAARLPEGGPALDAGAVWTRDTADATLRLAPALRIGPDAVAATLGVSLRSYF